MSSPQQSRRFPRAAVARPALLRQLGELRPVEGFVKTRVIGLGGCAVMSPEPLGLGSLMELSISFTDRVVRTDAHVVYELEREGGVEAGVEFLRLSPEDRALLESVVGSAANAPAG